MNKIYHYLFNIVAFIVIIFILFDSYQSFYPFKTLEVKSATVKSKEIKSGDVLYYTVDYCKYTDKPAIVYRTLHKIDESEIVPFPSVATISVTGCHVVDVPLKTYPEMESGEYYLLINAVFTINTKRDINVTFKTNSFIINK